MREERYVSYLRVSSARQGYSGLGLAAQQSAVQAFLEARGAKLIAEFAETESGARKDRPELQKAIQLCRKTKSKLVIARLDRLARNTAFLFNLRDSGLDFIACDLPEADKFTVGIMALVAERERELASERTKAALQAAKRRGRRLGNPKPLPALKLAWQARQQASHRFAACLEPIVQEIRNTGVSSLAGIAGCLNRRGYRTPMGKLFAPQSVSNLLAVIAGTGLKN